MGDYFVQTVRLLTTDSKIIVVPERIARVCKTVGIQLDMARNQQQLGCPIVLQRAKAQALNKIIEWINHHIDGPTMRYRLRNKASLTEWDAEFFKLDMELLNDILIAVNYLDIPLLLCMICDVHATLKRKKKPTSLYEVFRLAHFLEVDILKDKDPNYPVDSDLDSDMSDLDLPNEGASETPMPKPMATASKASGNDNETNADKNKESAKKIYEKPEDGQKQYNKFKPITVEAETETDSLSETDMEIQMINRNLIVLRLDKDDDVPKESAV